MKYARLDLGTIEAIVNKLGGLEGVSRFLSGAVEIIIKKHIIDCDADPFCPNDWTVESHRPGGQLEWNLDQMELWLAEGQQGDGTVVGTELQKLVATQAPLNANVLDYLLGHPELIPDEWKGKAIFFWGTIYRNSASSLVVRCLRWDGKQWDWDDRWLDYGFRSFNPALVARPVGK